MMDSGTPRPRVLGWWPRFGLDVSPRLRVDAKTSGRFLPESRENRALVTKSGIGLEMHALVRVFH